MRRQHKYILALRAYGDFAILMNALQYSSNPFDYHIIASAHLKPLFEALQPYLKVSNLNITFKELGIQHSLLGLFTNRHLLSVRSFQELKQLKLVLNQLPASELFVEQVSRKWLLSVLVQKKLLAIAAGNAVYASYANFFSATYPVISHPIKPTRVLILPTARQAFRNIPSEDILYIKQSFVDKAIVQAGFYANNQKAEISENDFLYSSFQELILRIIDSDFVFCPDSLQVHLCQLLGKPHTILHPNKHALSFFTPFVIETKSYFEFSTRFL